MTPTDRRIIAMASRGKSEQRIADRLQVRVAKVRETIASHRLGNACPDAVRNIALGSLQLQRAITLAQFEAAERYTIRSGAVSLDRFA